MRTVRGSWLCGISAAALLSLTAGVGAGFADGEPTDGDTVVATVNGTAISADAVRGAMIRRGADFLPGFSKMEKKEELVEDLVRTRILAQKAREAGYADDPEIAAQIDSLLADAYWRDAVDALEVAEVTPEDSRAYYDEHAEAFRQPLRARGAVLVLRWNRAATKAEKDRVRSRSRELLARAQRWSPSAFAKLVADHSEDPATRRSGGDTGFIVEGASVFRFDPPVIDALFDIEEVGEVAAVETERGIYLVQLRERKGGEIPTFDIVEGSIRRRLRGERKEKALADRYAEIKRGFEVEIDQEALRGVGPADLASSARPPSFPVGAPGQ